MIWLQTAEEGTQMWAAQLEQVLQGAVAVAVIGMILGALQCFFGYRLQKLWMALMGLAVGAVIGFGAGEALELPPWAPWVIALVAGILLAALAYKLVLLGVFALCVAICYVISYWYIREPRAVMLSVGLGTGVLLGVLAVKFTRPVLMGVTAMGGGLSAVKSLAALPMLSERIGTGHAVQWVSLILGLALGVAGFLYQKRHTKA